MSTRMINTIFKLTIMLIVFSTSYTAQAPFNTSGPQPMTNGMSIEMQEEMRKFEEQFAALSPEEQDEFFTSLDTAVKKIDDLSKTEDGKKILAKFESGSITDEELDSLINQLVKDEPGVPEKKEEEPVVSEKDEEDEKEPVILRPQFTNKHTEAIASINSLIAHINSSLVKAATVPEFPSKLKNWIKNKQVTLSNQVSWNDLKTDLERLVEQLSRLLERDPKTTEYYHINALIKNESLLNNLLKIESTVAQIEPRAQEVPLLGGRRMKTTSKRAYQALLNEYNEALYILNLTKELQALFALFDPVAKTYREQEEKDIKAAGSKKPVFYTGALGRYSAPTDYDHFAGSEYDDFTPMRYESPSAYIPSRAPRRFGTGATTQPSMSRPAQRRQTPAKRTSAPSKGDPSKDKKIGDSSEKEEKFVIPKEVQALQKEINDSIKKIQKKLKKAAELISNNKLIEKVEKELVDASPIDSFLAFELLPDLNKAFSMQKGVLGDIHQLHRKLKSAITRKSVQSALQRAYDKHKKEFDGLFDKLIALETEWQTHSKKIQPEKQSAYFGIEVAEEPLDDELEEQSDLSKRPIIAPYSFFDIKNGINQVKTAIARFAQEKLLQDVK